MTRDDIIRLALEAGISKSHAQGMQGFLERFAALVAAEEREARAKVCESLFNADENSCNEAEQCAQAIRARNAA